MARRKHRKLHADTGTPIHSGKKVLCQINYESQGVDQGVTQNLTDRVESVLVELATPNVVIPYCKKHVTPSAGKQFQCIFEHFHIVTHVTRNDERVLQVPTTTKLLTPAE